VDDSKVSGIKPETFHLVLYNFTGHEIARQMVANNGRYRFFNIANGEYYIGIELEHEEITRILLRLQENEKTEIRRDIALEWHPAPGTNSAGTAGTVAADSYNHKPENKARLDKATEAVNKKNYDEAAVLLNEALKTDPKDYIAWTELGTVRFRQERHGEAEDAYKRALQERPSFFLALLNLGKLRLAKQDFAAATETLSKAVTERPLSADANYYLGEAYLQVKKGSKAVGYLEQALKLDPIGKAEAHLRLAALYNGAGYKDKAAEQYEQFLLKKPDYPGKEKLEQYIKANKKT
jgi:Tfp pilus assembly protein PilF